MAEQISQERDDHGHPDELACGRGRGVIERQIEERIACGLKHEDEHQDREKGHTDDER